MICTHHAGKPSHQTRVRAERQKARNQTKQCRTHANERNGDMAKWQNKMKENIKNKGRKSKNKKGLGLPIPHPTQVWHQKFFIANCSVLIRFLKHQSYIFCLLCFLSRTNSMDVLFCVCCVLAWLVWLWLPSREIVMNKTRQDNHKTIQPQDKTTTRQDDHKTRRPHKTRQENCKTRQDNHKTTTRHDEAKQDNRRDNHKTRRPQDKRTSRQGKRSTRRDKATKQEPGLVLSCLVLSCLV